jgi:hypothetical protein
MLSPGNKSKGRLESFQNDKAKVADALIFRMQ